MTLEEVVTILDCEILNGRQQLKQKVETGCGCDLMSDVLAFIKPHGLLLTGLINSQVIRTAEMADIRAICFVRGKKPGDEVIALAREQGLPLLTTSIPLFEACGLLYQNGLVGCSEHQD